MAARLLMRSLGRLVRVLEFVLAPRGVDRCVLCIMKHCRAHWLLDYDKALDRKGINAGDGA